MFVCLGNICRSPAGEEILRQKAKREEALKLLSASCGIGDWHVGHPPDWRMQQAAKARGILLTSKAQQFKHQFLEDFDFILAADKEVLHDLYRYAKTPEHKGKISLMTEFSSVYKGDDIPDPYCLGEAAFELVLDMLDDGCEGLLRHIKLRH